MNPRSPEFVGLLVLGLSISTACDGDETETGKTHHEADAAGPKVEAHGDSGPESETDAGSGSAQAPRLQDSGIDPGLPDSSLPADAPDAAGVHTRDASVESDTDSGVLEPVDPVNPDLCSNVNACGGDVTGTWSVTSSCLDLSGELNLYLTSLACASAPATGTLRTSGSLIFREDGSYSDNTVTVGSVRFELADDCLSISGVAVECDRITPVFKAIGWESGRCRLDFQDRCQCELSTTQAGGMGMILPYVSSDGQYSTTGSVLTADNAAYQYCRAGDTLSMTPRMSALHGTVELGRDGDPTGAGGTSGMGGSSSGGAGGVMDGAGGAMGGAMSGGAGTGGAGGNGSLGLAPCDIYENAGTPCAAAHSTVRALFSSFDGYLYQVKRADGMTQDISVLTPGGFADSAEQDTFCNGSSCTIWRVHDQTGNGNFLEAQTPESSVGGYMGQTAADAEAELVSVGGHAVYSLFTRPKQAYWNNGSNTGMPLGAEPQGIYMVTSGTHFNGGCCYDYGNGQIDRNYHGGPTIDAVYFGNNTIWDTGAGDGPWVMADMEDGLISWGPRGKNPNSPSLPFPFVTAMEKNNGTTQFALKGGDATQATLTVIWDGSLPSGKSPMQKEGAVILGASGDCCYSNNNASEGTFYEGAIVAGYPSDETDQAIQQNVVEAGYGQ